MAGTETVGPFDGSPWAQDQWYRHSALWATSGVVDVPQSSPSGGALGLSFSGLTPTVAAGRAWARGGGYELAGGSKTLPAIAANTNASLSRRDRLVLRRDLAAKTITPVVLTGTPAASPASPALQQTEIGQWDVALFSWLTPPNSGTVVSDVLDERAFHPHAAAHPTYVSTRARDAALPAPSEAHECATSDDRIWRYDGSAWAYIGGGVAPDVFPTFGGGWSNQPGFDALRCWKDGAGIPHVTGTVQAVAFGANSLMATLPVGYRPNGTVSRRVYVGQSQVPQRCDIDSAGGITVMPTQAWGASYWTVDLEFHPNTTTTAS